MADVPPATPAPETPPPDATKPLWRRPIGWLLGFLGLCILVMVLVFILDAVRDNGAPTETATHAESEPGQADLVQTPEPVLEPLEEPAAVTEPEPGTEPLPHQPEAERDVTPEALALQGVGETATGGTYNLTVHSVERVQTMVGLPESGAGNVFLVVDVTKENTIGDVVLYDLASFRVQGPDGSEYEATPGMEPALGAGELQPNESTRGFVAFEVPEAMRGFVLMYDPPVVGGGHMAVRIRLDE
jgi:hypothetical protein